LLLLFTCAVNTRFVCRNIRKVKIIYTRQNSNRTNTSSCCSLAFVSAARSVKATTH